MKRILFSILALISYIGMANAQGERFVGTWLATDGSKSYQITFTLGKEITSYWGKTVTVTALYGSVSYLNNENKVIRRVKSNAQEKTLVAIIHLAEEKISVTNEILVQYNDKERNSKACFDVIISDDNNTLSWKFNIDLSEGAHSLSKGELPPQPTDLPHDITFKRISN